MRRWRKKRKRKEGEKFGQTSKPDGRSSVGSYYPATRASFVELVIVALWYG